MRNNARNNKTLEGGIHADSRLASEVPAVMDAKSPPEPTASEYAVQFGLAASDPAVQWIKAHQAQYSELVRDAQSIADNNGLNPANFPIKIDPKDRDTIGVEKTKADFIHSYVDNAIDPQAFSNVKYPINVGEIMFSPELTAADRKALLACWRRPKTDPQEKVMPTQI